jgi:glycerol-3-phosphate cytidylyltransferase
MKKGITFGTFDLCHAGHMLMFKEAKEQCDYLIVGLHSDPSLERPRKNKPIMSLAERKIILEGIKYIDEIVTYDLEEDLIDILVDYKPDVRIIGADWKNKHFTGFELPIETYYNTRGHGYSSTELRERIKHAK